MTKRNRFIDGQLWLINYFRKKTMKIHELLNALIIIFLYPLILMPILSCYIVVISRIPVSKSIILSSNSVSYISHHQYKNVCWIFDKKILYQVMVSFYSVIMNNPNDKFIFYFIIPVKSKIDLKKFNYFLNPYSKIEIRYFKPEHAFAPYLEQKRCRHSPIIVVKVWLSKILPDVDKILFLDSDMINVAPISDVWNFDLNNKTIAATLRVTKRWINSGFIFYNLNEIRKRQNLINCAFKNSCFIDDFWHTTCHTDSIKIVPYRYNVEFYLMIKPDKTMKQENIV